MKKVPKVFISYSWDSEEHKSWVASFANRLRMDGIEANLDQYLSPGEKLPQFMESEVRESEFVLIICTPNYCEKSNKRLGGVGYEGNIITGEVLTYQNFKKFIPVLRLGNWKTSTPSWLAGSLGFDFSGGEFPENFYLDLINTLHGKRQHAPPIGCPPDNLKIGNYISNDGVVGYSNLSQVVTIAIPVYNESKLLDSTFKSLRAEGLLDKYITIVCDDGSKDNSFNIIKKWAEQIPSIRCIKNQFNERKVGAIWQLAKEAQTPYIFTLDADCCIIEEKSNSLDDVAKRMNTENISASYFRIVPEDGGWLCQLQKLDYAIFTDTLRKILGIPVCLIGQGVLWNRESLLHVLDKHSGDFDGDDLENTIIALSYKMELRWERKSVYIRTKPKNTILELFKQRGLSWDFGLLRVLWQIKALKLTGISGAFYKNSLLVDIIAHPFRLASVPMLFSLPLYYICPINYQEIALEIVRLSVNFSFGFGVTGIACIWVLSFLNTAFFTKKIIPTIKFSCFNAVYLSSPFIYAFSFPLFYNSTFNLADIAGSAIHWLGWGLLLTYFWWILLTLLLLSLSSIQVRSKIALLKVIPLAPIYFFMLFLICKSIGITKYIIRLLLHR